MDVLILSPSTHIPDYALVVLTQQGCSEELVRQLIDNKGFSSDKSLGTALGWSIVNQHKAIQRLLEKDWISDAAFNYAVCVAVEEGCEPAVKELLFSGRKIPSSEVFHACLRKALQSNEIAIAKMLFSNYID